MAVIEVLILNHTGSQMSFVEYYVVRPSIARDDGLSSTGTTLSNIGRKTEIGEHAVDIQLCRSGQVSRAD